MLSSSGPIAIPAAAAKPVDLRSPDAQSAMSSAPPNARGTDVAASDQQVPTTVARQDRRSPDAVDLTPTVRPVPGLPMWPLNPEPLTPVSLQAIEDDGTPWLTVGLIAAPSWPSPAAPRRRVASAAGSTAPASRRSPHATGARRCPAPVAAGSPYATTRYF